MRTVADSAEATLRVTVSLEELAHVRAFVREAAAAAGADKSTVSALVQSVDEWVTNVVVHGYRGPGPVEVSVRRSDDDVVVEVRDEAPTYDPATAPPFDPDLPLDQRPFGGMGIALIRDLCTRFDHVARPDGGNAVTMRRPALSADNNGGPQ